MTDASTGPAPGTSLMEAPFDLPVRLPMALRSPVEVAIARAVDGRWA